MKIIPSDCFKTLLLATLAGLPLASGSAAQIEISTPSVAKARVLAPQVMVSPDRADWSYTPGDPVFFTVRVLSDGHPVPGAKVRYRVGPEKFEQVHEPVDVPADGLRIDGGTMNQPGFLRCAAEFEYAGQKYRALATAGFSPEKIQPTQSEPPDFDAFWAKHLAELSAIPIRAVKTRTPEACTAEVEVSNVSYQTWGANGAIDRFYGVLTEPAKPGRYPAALKVPGAGVRAYHGDVELAAAGLIVLEIGIHGIPVNLPDVLYDNLRSGALRDYPSYNLDDPLQYYYLRVYLACVRANDFLTTHENWDGKNLVVFGGSQGGQLTVVTSALDRRVTGSVANYPAYCDVTGYLHGRAGGWPHLLAKPVHQTEAKIRTTGYYDTVNFAKRLRSPGSFAWGYNDETCPVTSMFAAYNVVTAPKELWLQLNMGHPSIPEFNARLRERVLAMAHGAAFASTTGR
jgi:cephalosporin-C deacetylase